ncbi:AraC family transcriptional regulator N-terminal domain-containing protein [Neisseria sp. Ec49-e6-T10]|uniref:AraC family transcriptional regulator n=1 Tax=Neisseria sp. Ec49-e6-T10 TaxID=3140744 RepID=UPI003EB7503F
MKPEISFEVEHANACLKEKLLQHLPKQDRIDTAIEGLTIFRRDETFKRESCFYQPVIGVVVQGSKRSIIGNEEYQYGEYYCMAAGVDMPSLNHITVASADKPFLAVSIKLDRYLITQLMTEVPKLAASIQKPIDAPVKGIVVTEVSHDILNAFLRLVELLDHPERIPVLAPMIIREIHYLLLTGPKGECLRMVSVLGTQANRIARAISWLRDNYTAPLDINTLAQRVNMAPSSFHRHFRRMTTLSPLQFQKRLRLYEAERLMLAEGHDTISAALKVGYESATQFNREYKRQFGEPPHRDVTKKRLIGINMEDITYPVV